MNEQTDNDGSLLNRVNEARTKWICASDKASKLANDLFQPGSGHGDPEARMQDEHRLQTARHEAERLFREYNDLSRQEIDLKMMRIQESQKLATWASFSVAAMVGLATIIGIVIGFFKQNC